MLPCEPNHAAFPLAVEDTVRVLGLTKREYFSLHLMQGLLASGGSGETEEPMKVAEYAVECAEALIRVLNSPIR